MKSNQNPFNFSDKARNWIFGIHVVVRQTSSLLVPISDWLCLLKHLAIRIGNPNLNTNLIQFLFLFLFVFLSVFQTYSYLVPKWNIKEGHLCIFWRKKTCKRGFSTKLIHIVSILFKSESNMIQNLWHQK